MAETLVTNHAPVTHVHGDHVHAAHSGSTRHVYWSAIFAGVLVALVSQVLLSLLGMGIGASTVKPTTQDDPLAGLGTGAALWWILTGTVSLFLGGWTAGRFSGLGRDDAPMHGVLTWGLTTIIALCLLTTGVGAVIGGAFRVMGQGATLLASGAGAAAPAVGKAVGNAVEDSGVDWDSIKREARALLRDTGKPGLSPEALEQRGKEAKDDVSKTARRVAGDPLSADEELSSLLKRMYGRGTAVTESADRDALANVIANRTGKSQDEAKKIVANYEATYQKAKEKYDEVKTQAEAKAREAGDKVASAVARASFWGFAVLLLGAVAGFVGAMVAAPKGPVVVRTGSVTTTPRSL